MLLAALLLAAMPSLGADAVAVAVAVGEVLSRQELAAAGDEAARVARLRGWLFARLLKDYIRSRGLEAGPAEVAELAAYNREFERRDRAQRARKLAELERRLAGSAIDPSQREWLEEFRRVLARMARREAAGDGVPDPAAAAETDYAPWVEYWKALQALYAEFGGAVAATEAGLFPHGAWAALVARYERDGRLVLFDARLRAQLFAALAQPPAIAVPADEVDFTPYWKRPIPPSYFPD